MSEEGTERMPDEDQLFLAKNLSDTVDVGNLGTDTKCAFQFLHIGVEVSRLEPAKWLRRPARASLIVVIELDSIRRKEILEALKIGVVQTRPSVQQQNLNRSFTDFFRPNMIATVDFNHP